MWLPLTLAALICQEPVIAPNQIVCIDPGHPSEVGVGTKGKHSTEVGIAWHVAQALKLKLEGHAHVVVMTKSKEMEVVTNKRRAEIANEAHAAIMIRLHCDASNGSGFAVYYPSQAGVSHGVRGPSNEVIAGSKAAAQYLHTAMAAALKGKLHDEGLKTDLQTAIGAKQGALTGSVFSKVPAVLVEMCVLTNPKDEAFIQSKAGFDAMVDALDQGVMAALSHQ